MAAALPRTIPHAVVAAADACPSALAVVDGERGVTYAQLLARMQEAAAGFVAAGVKSGDRVAIWAPNSLDWIVACLGLQAAGAALVPLNTRFKGREAQYILNRSRARLLVTVGRFLGADYPALLDGLSLPHLEQTVLLDTNEWRSRGWEAFVDQGRASPASRREADARLATLSGDAVSDILFTSGTTGDPRGAITTHAQNIAVFDGWATATGLRRGDRYLVVFPFFHSAGYKAGCVASILRGATVYPEAVFDADALAQRVVRERITVLPAPPTVFQALLDGRGASARRLDGLRVAVTGATMVPPTLIEAMRRELGIQRVLTGYGLTETCGVVTMTTEEDSADTVATTCGRALPGVEIRCVDDAGEPVPAGEEGEILVRGPNVMRGYLDDPASTGAAIDADGWFHTGDVGRIDERGYLRITDRKKDMFIVGGFNCYPAEVEKALLRHPAVSQVAVCGVPDARLGEVGRAFVVRAAGAALTGAELIEWCRAELANYKVPRTVEFVDSLPTNAMGKVQKFRLGQLTG